MIKFLQKNKEKLIVMSVMDLKLRYQNSVIGFFWSFLKPLLQFLVYFTVFGIILKVGSGLEYALQLFFGVIVWAFFAEATSLGLNSFISKASLISKVSIDKIIPPIAAFLTPLISFIINFIIFMVVYMLFYQDVTLYNIWLFVISLIQISILILSLNIILSFSNVFFRDFQQIWEMLLIYGVFLTPILYTIPIPENYTVIYYALNPLAFPLENMKIAFFKDYSPILIYDVRIWLTHTAVLVTLIMIAYKVKKKLENKVVDYL